MWKIQIPEEKKRKKKKTHGRLVPSRKKGIVQSMKPQLMVSFSVRCPYSYVLFLRYFGVETAINTHHVYGNNNSNNSHNKNDSIKRKKTKKSERHSG